MGGWQGDSLEVVRVIRKMGGMGEVGAGGDGVSGCIRSEMGIVWDLGNVRWASTKTKGCGGGGRARG